MRLTSSAGGIRLTLLTFLLACTADRDLPLGTEAPSLSVLDATAWSEPEPLDAPVNNPLANEQGPALSADGLSLYFCSNRAPSAGNDLWVSRRLTEQDGWMPPQNLGPVVNSASGDCGPSLSEDGRLLFFTSGRLPSAGLNDIYMSTRTDPSDDLSWGPPIRLGPEINTTLTEFSPFITRFRDDDCDGEECGVASAELYFERVSPTSAADIYVVRVTSDGVALGPAAPVETVNTLEADGRPTVRFDGREMILQSNRGGRGGDFDLFVSTRKNRKEAWSTPEPITELSVAGRHEIHPYLSRDARTVFFIRGTGVANDIWMATRGPGRR
jgi:Tol biopolymer transport system component